MAVVVREYEQRHHKPNPRVLILTDNEDRQGVGCAVVELAFRDTFPTVQPILTAFISSSLVKSAVRKLGGACSGSLKNAPILVIRHRAIKASIEVSPSSNRRL